MIRHYAAYMVRTRGQLVLGHGHRSRVTFSVSGWTAFPPTDERMREPRGLRALLPFVFMPPLTRCFPQRNNQHLVCCLIPKHQLLTG